MENERSPGLPPVPGFDAFLKSFKLKPSGNMNMESIEVDKKDNIILMNLVHYKQKSVYAHRENLRCSWALSYRQSVFFRAAQL